jgi:hypothetical protein
MHFAAYFSCLLEHVCELNHPFLLFFKKNYKDIIFLFGMEHVIDAFVSSKMFL